MKISQNFRQLSRRQWGNWLFSGYFRSICRGGAALILVYCFFSGSPLLAQATYSLEQLSRFFSGSPHPSIDPYDFHLYACRGRTPSTGLRPGPLSVSALPLPLTVAFPSGAGGRAAGEGRQEDSPAADAAPATVSLLGQVWDVATGEVLPSVAMEVYQKQPDGRIMLAYTGRVPSGAFTIPLVRGVTHIIILSRTGYQPEAFYVAADFVDTQRSFYLKRRTAPADTAVAGSISETGRSFHDKASLPVDNSLSPSTDTLLLAASSPDLSILSPGKEAAPAETTELWYEKGGISKNEEGTPEWVELTSSTSLRRGPSHETEVLLRFHEGDRVEVLEKTDKYWWKVRHKGSEGYVKALLLAPL